MRDFPKKEFFILRAKIRSSGYRLEKLNIFGTLESFALHFIKNFLVAWVSPINYILCLEPGQTRYLVFRTTKCVIFECNTQEKASGAVFQALQAE